LDAANAVAGDSMPIPTSPWTLVFDFPDCAWCLTILRPPANSCFVSQVSNVPDTFSTDSIDSPAIVPVLPVATW